MLTTTSPTTTQSTITASQTSAPITQSIAAFKTSTPTTLSNTIGNPPIFTTQSSDSSGSTPITEQTVQQELLQFLCKQRENIELQNKGFEAMKTLMSLINKTSENLLKAERLRMQGTRGNLLNSTAFLDESSTHTGAGIEVQSSPQEINIEVTKALNASITALKSTLESSKKSQNYQVPRKYTLNSDSDINIWLDKLKSELSSKDLLDVIDPTVIGPDNLDVQTIAKRKQAVREIITSHLDDKYYKRVLTITDPIMVITSLKEAKRVEKNVTHTSVRTKLYGMKLKPKESIDEFWNKFDNTIVEYESCDNAVPLTDEEKRSAFYQAVSKVIPEARTADLLHRQFKGRSMTLVELRSHLLQLEAEKKSETSQEQDACANQAKRFKSHHDNCYRCNKTGHYVKQCPLAATSEWYCYICKVITDHNTNSCPKNEDSQNSGRSDYRRGRGRGRGRGAFRRGTFFKGGFGGKSKEYTKSKPKTFKKQAAPPKDGDKKKPQARQAGMNFKYINNVDNITFIADSGATEHIINKSLILSNFKHCTGEVIKSANKNKSADIVIDGVGDLYLKSNLSKIKLTNVLSAENIANNLISLRRFVDAGLGIFLDDKKLEIFDKETGETCLSGTYVKPNWLVTFEVKHAEEVNRPDYTTYSCTAEIISPNEFSEQSQTVPVDLNLQKMEGDLDVFSHKSTSSELGRESQKKSLLEKNRNNIEAEITDFLLDEQTLNRRILDFNSADALEEFNNIKSAENNIQQLKIIKIDEGMLWHIRLGHPSLNYLKELKKSEQSLCNVNFKENILDCETCILAKMEKLPFKESRVIADRPLHTIHVDTMGQFKINSFPGAYKYIIVFLDDFSRFAKIYSIKNKNEAASCLESFINTTRNLLGKNEKVCYIRTDNAREFTGGDFVDVMHKEKIESDYAPPYTPELNGTAERFNKTIQQKIRALLFDSGLPKSMWILAAETAVNMYNRTPHKTNGFVSPLNKLNAKISTHMNKIRRFGCLAYVKLPISENKFSERAIRSILVGYSRTGYVLWEPTSGKFLNSRHVRFNEKLVYKDIYKTKDLEVEDSPTIEKQKEVEVDDNSIDGKIDSESSDANTPVTKDSKDKLVNSDKSKKRKLDENVSTDTKFKKLRASKRKPKPKIDDNFVYAKTIKKFTIVDEEDFIYAMLSAINKDPGNYKECLLREDCVDWMKAVKEELKSIDDNKVYNLVKRPVDANVVNSRWVFKTKIGKNGETIYKARVVVRGFLDVNEYELKETYAPVSRLPVIRLALAIINKLDLDARQMDVKTAFLYGTLEKAIFMEIPEGYDCSDEIREKMVWKLEKSLYGLKISPKRWNKKFTEEALKIGLENDLNEPCLFSWRKDGKIAIVILYVDDMIAASNVPEKLDEIINHFSKVFEMKILGEPENFLGMKIHRDRSKREMSITQPEYTEKILERFDLKECNAQDTPMITRQVKNRNNKNIGKLDDSNIPANAPYREAIGSLLYLAGATRPDIAYAVNLLSRRQNNPTKGDWTEVKRIFRYLKGTTDLGLYYRGKTEIMEAMTDTSFRDRENSTSTSGYIIQVYGDTVAWRSHKQSSPVTSTCQAEYLAMSESCKEIISLDKATRDIIGKTMYPVTIRCDNKSACNCTQMEGSHKLKDFDDDVELIKSNLAERERTGKKPQMAETHGDFVKSCVLAGKIKVKWISTKENIADIMTKPLPSTSHIKLRNKMMNF